MQISNFRCFTSAEAEFQYPGRPGLNGQAAARPGFENLNLILGDNGSGKSSILKAIAVAVLGSVLGTSGFRPYYLVRSDTPDFKSESALVAVKLVGEAMPYQSTASLVRAGVEDFFLTDLTGPWETEADTRPGPAPESLRSADNREFFLCGYGANRCSEDSARYDEAARIKSRSLRYQRVASLFEEQYSLTSFNAWVKSWPALDPLYKRELLPLLDGLLSASGIRMKPEQDPLFVLSDEALVPFDALSDGYRAFLAWVIDLLRHLVHAAGEKSVTQVKGVVLVDEVDLHLHPTWQRSILSGLARTFPNLQFIVTSHSPILAGCLPAENVLVVRRTADGPSQIVIPEEDVYGKAVDEILASSYFELDTTLPPELQARAQARAVERARLARQFLQSKDPNQAMAYLRALTDDTHPD